MQALPSKMFAWNLLIVEISLHYKGKILLVKNPLNRILVVCERIELFKFPLHSFDLSIMIEIERKTCISTTLYS